MSPSVSIAVAFEDVADAPNSRLYFSRALLTNATYEKVNRNDQRVSKLAQQLLEIPGVTGALIAPYDVHVMKAALYSWDEIHTQVMDLVLAKNFSSITPASETPQ